MKWIESIHLPGKLKLVKKEKNVYNSTQATDVSSIAEAVGTWAILVICKFQNPGTEFLVIESSVLVILIIMNEYMILSLQLKI